MKNNMIAWNGCDSYVETTESIFTTHEEFKPFEVIEVKLDELPKDEDGEPDLNGILGATNGKFYRGLK